jgi:tetratricopeptide (TPR) repeat protein
MVESVQYVGDRACAECHSDIAETYARSAMAQSWREPATTSPIEEFAAAHEVVDSSDGYHYQVVKEGDRVFQREFRVNEQHEQTYHQLREVAYVLGSGSKGRSYVTESNGGLWLMPVAWYSATNRWALNPNYETSNLRFSRAVVPECIVCHNSYPSHVAGSENRYRTPVPQGIGCERCHGPGELHVTRQRSSVAAAADDSGDRTIVNPARLPVELQQDVCLQCHLSTHAGAVFLNGSDPFDFRPGQPLREFRADFELGGAAGDQFSAISHGTRMAKSACFIASQGKLTCTSCHDPHLSTREVAPGFFNSRCLTCHTSQSCNRPPSEPAQTITHSTQAMGDCVGCHMPKRGHGDIDHTVTTDHWIRRPVDHDGVDDTLQSNEYIALADFFGVASSGDRGIATVRYGMAQHKPIYVQKGVQLLRDAIHDQPRSIRWQYWLGYALRQEGALDESREYLERAFGDGAKARVLSEAELVGLHLELARLYLAMGSPRRALEVCDELAKFAPENVACHELAVRAHAQLGQPQLLLRRAQTGLELDPTSHYLWGMLGLGQWAFERNPTRALESLTRALELEPTDATTYLLIADVYQALSQPDRAEEALLQAVHIDSDAVPANLALAKFYIQVSRPRDAVPYLKQILAKSPNNFEASQLMRSIDSANGVPDP